MPEREGSTPYTDSQSYLNERRYPDQWGRPPNHPQYGQPPAAPPRNTTPGTTPGTPGMPPPGQTPPPGQGQTPPPGAPPGTPPAPGFNRTNQAGSGYGGYNYGGYDFAQDGANRDTGRSAKYAFADATREAGEAGIGANEWATKEGAEKFFNTHIKSKLEQNGYKVLEVVGDKARVVTREDFEAGNTEGSWIDFVINAGGDNPQLAWQAEQKAAAFGADSKFLDDPNRVRTVAPAPGTSGPAPGGNRDSFAYENLVDPTLADTAYV